MTLNKLDKIVEELSNLTLLEANELSQILEKKWGVASIMAAPQAQQTSSESKEKQEKQDFEVVLKSCGQAKIAIIKLVKDILGLGLREAKALVDKAPVALKTLPKKKAEEVKEQLEKAGGIVELK